MPGKDASALNLPATFELEGELEVERFHEIAKIALLPDSRSLPEFSFLTSSKNYATAFPMSPSTRKAYLKRVKRIKT
jgi:hypothetical protein